MRCRKCQSKNLIMRPNAKNPSATEVVCGDCGAWQKFISKDEIRLFELRSSQKKLTNADRIRHMSDEELANAIKAALGKMSYDCYHCPAEDFCHSGECEQAWLDWLKQPAKEE